MDSGSVQIICSLLSGIFGALGAYFASMRGRRQDSITQARRDQKIDDQMRQLADKVDKHNEYSDKIAAMSESMVSIRKDIEFLKSITTK